MQVRKAGIDDIELLVKLRIDYICEEKGTLSQKEQGDLKQQLRSYYSKWITGGGFVAFIAEDYGCVMSTAFLSIVERPPRQAFSSCLVGTVYNVFTYKDFRRQGIATKVMSALINEAWALNVSSIELSATKDGKYLYDILGFTTTQYTSMKLKRPIDPAETVNG